jgi:hypothetical protein
MFYFFARKDYESLQKECGRLQDELTFFRGKFNKELKRSEELNEKLTSMYEQARLDAATRGRVSDENVVLKKELDVMRDRLDFVHEKKFDDIKEYLNPEPEDPEIRAAYVAQIAGYFNGGLRDYLNYMKSLFKNQAVMFPLTERETDFYRAAVNICELLNEWGQRMFNEHMANSRGEGDTEDAFDAEDESVENIKKAVTN